MKMNCNIYVLYFYMLNIFGKIFDSLSNFNGLKIVWFFFLYRSVWCIYIYCILEIVLIF